MIENKKEYIIWESEPYRVILRNTRYFIQDNIHYQEYADVCSVNDKILAVLIANILCVEFNEVTVNHRVKDVYHPDVDKTVREHLFTFHISEALGVEYKEVSDEQ